MKNKANKTEQLSNPRENCDYIFMKKSTWLEKDQKNHITRTDKFKTSKKKKPNKTYFQIVYDNVLIFSETP